MKGALGCTPTGNRNKKILLLTSALDTGVMAVAVVVVVAAAGFGDGSKSREHDGEDAKDHQQRQRRASSSPHLCLFFFPLRFLSSLARTWPVWKTTCSGCWVSLAMASIFYLYAANRSLRSSYRRRGPGGDSEKQSCVRLPTETPALRQRIG